MLLQARESVANASQKANSQSEQGKHSAMPLAYINRANSMIAAASSAQRANNQPLARKFARLALSEVRVAQATIDTLNKQQKVPNN